MAKQKTKAEQTQQKNNEHTTKKTLTKKDLIAQSRRDRVVATFAGDMKKYEEQTYSQKFTSYTDIYGSEDLDYDLIDGLYHSTVLNRVLKKIASDSVPEMFRVQIVDLEGNRIEDLEEECFMYTARLKRKHIKQMYLQALKYGTSFLYIGNKEEDMLTNMYLLHPKNMEPEINEADGEIEQWIYKGTDGDIEIPPEDVICFAYDADIGQVFGMSFLGKLVQTLHLMLNTELNLAEIVDKFAIPILQWLIEVGDDEELQEEELEGIVESLQNQLQYSNDVVTTDRITTETIGFAQHQYDMVSTLQALKESFGLLTFPMSIIGGKADNLSAIKTQAAQYINDLKDLQMDFSDTLVEQLYEPFLEASGKTPGKDYANIYLIFPTLTTESNADVATWLFPALRYGLISRDEARAQLSFRGQAIPVEQLEFIDDSWIEKVNADIESALTQPAGGTYGDPTKPNEPKNRSGKGDPKDTKNES